MGGARSSGLVAAAIAMAAGVSACGGTSPATSAVLVQSADVSAAAANPVTISPLPGTSDASPATQISFLGRAGTRVVAVQVVGSRSGPHRGVLREYSTGTGASFLPAQPFRAGEHVSVHARIAGAGSGEAASTTFAIATQATLSQAQFPPTPGNPQAIQHYISAPSLTPSALSISTPAQTGATPGDLFLAPYQGDGSAGPMIAAQDGSLIWFHPLPAGEAASNFGVQQYQGKPVLAWWQGRILQVGFGQGEDMIFDSSYRRLAVVRAGNGYQADLHVIRLTPQGTAWIDVFDPIRMNLSGSHGSSDGVVTDSVVQEIDIKTGLVMWEWHALGHVALSESNNPVRAGTYPWDYVHINSDDPGPAGDLLLSARNTWTLYDISIHSGGIIWRLGGAHSSFKLGGGARFYWQHDAEFQPGGLISLFDNGSDPPKEKQSRGLLLAPDVARHTVSLVKQFVNPSKILLAESQGGMLGLPGGNWFLGYGQLPNFTEFNAAGQVLLDGTLGKNVQSFRTLLYPWSAQPKTEPALVVASAGGGELKVAASWNGASNVAAWRMLAGSSPSTLIAVASARAAGFQTSITAHAAGPFVAVQALDGAGAALATSATLKA
jgi:hypothetical protein